MQLEVPILIIKNLIYDVILGIDTLRKINGIINFNNNKLMCMVNNNNYSMKLSHIYIDSESGSNYDKITKPPTK